MVNTHSSVSSERRTRLRRTTDRPETRLIRLEEVLAICALGKTALYEAIRRDGFPAPIALFGRSKRWVYQEIQDWLTQEIRQLRAAGGQSRTLRQTKPLRNSSRGMAR